MLEILNSVCHFSSVEVLVYSIVRAALPRNGRRTRVDLIPTWYVTTTPYYYSASYHYRISEVMDFLLEQFGTVTRTGAGT